MSVLRAKDKPPATAADWKKQSDELRKNLLAAWGGFPAFTGYFAQSLTIRPAGVLVAAGCSLLSAAQRRLSTPVRELRRRTAAVTGEQQLTDGTTVALTKAGLAAPLEGSLSALWIAVVLLAVGLLAAKL